MSGGRQGRLEWVASVPAHWLACQPAPTHSVHRRFSAHCSPPINRSIAARLRVTPCIPDASGTLLLPGQALVCRSPAVRSLVTQLAPEGQLLGLLGKGLVCEELRLLQESRRLR